MFVPARTSCVRAIIVFLPPGLPVVVVVAISLRALVIDSRCEITHKKNAFQFLETHSVRNFGKSVEFR